MQREPSGEAGSAALRARLRHVHWIGGGSGAGKSTIARLLADRHGWRLYPTDDVMQDHARRTTPGDAPLLHAFLAMDMDERWVTRSPATMLETFHWFRGEGFGLIVEDLLRLPAGPRVVVEGFRLLPRLVRPLLTEPAQAVWLLPSPGFRRAAIRGRSAPEERFTWRTGDPQKAERNVIERDDLFTARIADETRRLRLHAIEVHSGLTEDDLARRVAQGFGL